MFSWSLDGVSHRSGCLQLWIVIGQLGGPDSNCMDGQACLCFWYTGPHETSPRSEALLPRSQRAPGIASTRTVRESQGNLAEKLTCEQT